MRSGPYVFLQACRPETTSAALSSGVAAFQAKGILPIRKVRISLPRSEEEVAVTVSSETNMCVTKEAFSGLKGPPEETLRGSAGGSGIGTHSVLPARKVACKPLPVDA